MINDSNRLGFLELYSMFSTEELTHAQYDTLRDLAARHLSYQALAQCLAPKLPDKPEYVFGPCVIPITLSAPKPTSMS